MEFNQSHVLNTLTLTMSEFMHNMTQLETISIDEFSKEDTLVVMIDMINGFCKFGPLSSEYVNAIIPQMGRFLDATIKKEIPIISYRDAHPQNAREFQNYPPHCLAGSDESNLVEELYRDALIDVPKNSTNGFLAKNPLDLVDGPNIKHIFVIGCVTDICVRDFTSTMNKYLQQIDQPCQVYVIENLVETFHIEGVHDRQVEHLLALYQLHNSGIKLVRA